MATPRVTIDALPEQAIPEDANMFVVQDSGVSKKISWATLRAQPSQALTDHIDDTTDAHDATAISATSSGTGVDGATVQAQLGQLATLTNTKIDQAAGDTRYVNTSGDTMTGALTLAADPTVDLHAATKHYVDEAVIEAGGGITQPDADARYVNLTGDTMTGALSVDALVTTNTGVALPVGEPSAADRAARKDYVDTQVATRLTQAAADTRYVNIDGDTMTGQLIVGSSSVSSVVSMRGASNNSNLEGKSSDGATRYGQLQFAATGVRLTADAGDVWLRAGATDRLTVGSTAVTSAVPLNMTTSTAAPIVIKTPAGQDASVGFEQPAGTARGNLGVTTTGNITLNAATGNLTLSAAGSVLLGNAQDTDVNAVVRKDYADALVQGGTFSGTTDASGVVNITHGLGRVPVAFIGMVHSSTTFLCTSPATAANATTFPLTIFRRDTGAALASSAITVRWIAL